MLDALETTALAARALYPADRQATLVRLTGKGEVAGRALAAHQDEFARFLFAGVGQIALNQFQDTGGKMLARLRDRGYGDLRPGRAEPLDSARPGAGKAAAARVASVARPIPEIWVA